MAPALSSSTLTTPIFSDGEADDGEAYDGEADVQQCLPTPALAVADPFGEADGYYDGVYHLLAPSSHIVAFATPAAVVDKAGRKITRSQWQQLHAVYVGVDER